MLKAAESRDRKSKVKPFSQTETAVRYTVSDLI